MGYTIKQAAYTNPDSAFVYIEGKGMHPWNPIQYGSCYIRYDTR